MILAPTTTAVCFRTRLFFCPHKKFPERCQTQLSGDFQISSYKQQDSTPVSCKSILFTAVKKCFDKLIRLKGAEVHNAFAYANPFNRQSQLFLNCHNHTALSSAV